MATLREQQIAKKHQEQQLLRQVGSGLDVSASLIKTAVGAPTNPIGTLIDFISGVGIAAWSFLGKKKSAKEQQRLARSQNETKSTTNRILLEIRETGVALIDKGYTPGTKEFETLLVQVLYPKLGYKGNCNATIWAPGQEKNKKVWFKISKNGRSLQTTPGFVAPDNFQSYWYVQCKNIQDFWVNVYQDKLISEGRLQELEQFQTMYKKGNLILKIAFGGVFAILGLTLFINMIRINN